MKRYVSFLAMPALALSLTACGNEAQGAVEDLLKNRQNHEVSQLNGVTSYDFGSTEVARNTTMEATSPEAWRMTMTGPKLPAKAFGKLEQVNQNGSETLYNITGGRFKGGQLQDLGGQEFKLSSADWVLHNPSL